MCDYSDRASSPGARSLRIDGKDYPVLFLPIPPEWHGSALEKRYDLVARVADEDHLALRCQDCGGLNKVKVFTLRSANTTCRICQDRRWRSLATEAGATFVRRCPRDHRYVWLQLNCQHEIRRQAGLVRKAAGGEVGFRCNTCHSTREAKEARARGWELVGPDPKHVLGYRVYRHDCGHCQRIARANMQTGRFGCAGCGAAWPSAPSSLYVMRFTLQNSRVLIKLGMSRDAKSRLRHQLLRHAQLQAEIVDHLPVETGQRALQLEKSLHGMLRRRFPEQVVPHAVFASHLNVVTEIYEPVLEPFLRQAFDRLRASGAA